MTYLPGGPGTHNTSTQHWVTHLQHAIFSLNDVHIFKNERKKYTLHKTVLIHKYGNKHSNLPHLEDKKILFCHKSLTFAPSVHLK
jgi:hypothetical protein